MHEKRSLMSLLIHALASNFSIPGPRRYITLPVGMTGSQPHLPSATMFSSATRMCLAPFTYSN